MNKGQQSIVDKNFKNGIHKISALAGTGKTTTAKMLLQEFPCYTCSCALTFNAENKDEWRTWVKKTTPAYNISGHSYASLVMETFPTLQWTWTGGKKACMSDYKKLLENETSIIISHVKNIVNEYSISLTSEITPTFSRSVLGSFISEEYVIRCTHLAKVLWSAMIDYTQPLFKLDESGGMKLIYLTVNKLKYSVIIWDEAQDIPDIHFGVMKKFEKQTCHILFGDDYQTINLWRNGMNGKFNKIPSIASLPKTYRFGDKLSGFANSLMMVMDEKHIKDYEISMIGNENKHTFPVSYTNLIDIHLPTQKPILYLARTNGTILCTLLKFGKHIQQTHQIKCKFTEKKKDSATFLKNLQELVNIKFRNARYNYPSIWRGKTWYEIESDYEQDLLTDDQKDIVEFVVRSNGSPSTYLKIQEIIQGNDKKKGIFELSTVHKKKGCENDIVILADDFLNIRPKSNDFEEYCIFNTAITRAMSVLYYPYIYDIRKYQYAGIKISRAIVRYFKWKKACIKALKEKLPDELCEYIMNMI